MDLSHVIAFNIALMAAIASPGPAFLIALRTTLGAGRRAGIAVGLGLGLVAALWTLAALLGLDIVFTLFPWAYGLMKLGGAAYLLYIAWGMWRGAGDPVTSALQPSSHAFRQGVMINLLNPKSVLFAAAVLVVIFPAGLSLAETLFIVANHLAVEVLFYTALAFGLSRPAVSAAYLRAKRLLDRIAAGVLGLLGLRLLLSRE
jgi:threonine/homoserine/homoserine lactone efflux protein